MKEWNPFFTSVCICLSISRSDVAFGLVLRSTWRVQSVLTHKFSVMSTQSLFASGCFDGVSLNASKTAWQSHSLITETCGSKSILFLMKHPLEQDLYWPFKTDHVVLFHGFAQSKKKEKKEKRTQELFSCKRLPQAWCICTWVRFARCKRSGVQSKMLAATKFIPASFEAVISAQRGPTSSSELRRKWRTKKFGGSVVVGSAKKQTKH